MVQLLVLWTCDQFVYSGVGFGLLRELWVSVEMDVPSGYETTDMQSMVECLLFTHFVTAEVCG